MDPTTDAGADAIEFKVAAGGADVVVATDSLRRHGVAHMRTLLRGRSVLLRA